MSVTETELVVVQYLSFNLDKELFSVKVEQVREVLELQSITRIPKTPDFMRGVINVRGSVVPVVDLRLKFGMQAVETTVDTCIIVVEVQLDGEAVVLGILVDSVEEVIDLEQDQIEPPPKIGTKLSTEFIRGIGKREDNFVILLDIDRMFSAEEIEVMQGAESLSSAITDDHA